MKKGAPECAFLVPHSARQSGRVDRELLANGMYLLRHAFDDGLICVGVEDVAHPVRQLRHFRLAEAAGGDGRSADADTGGELGRSWFFVIVFLFVFFSVVAV